MKRFKNILFVLFALVVVSVSCVDDDFDTPPYKEIPVGDVVTIANLKTYFDDSSAYINEEVGVAYKFKKDITVYATVTMDDKSGNLYKQAYIQDKTGGIALFFDASGGIQEGDTIRINLNGLIINQYAKAYQINSLSGNGFTKQLYITTIDVSKRRTPEEATISEINSNPPYYQGRLVKINDVQFVVGDTAQYYADYEKFVTRNLTLENGNGQSIIVRTSGYASFADEKTPKGSGSIIAVVGQFSNDMQLYIRNTSEVIMDNDRIGAGGGPGEGEGSFDTPYNVASGIANQDQTGVWVEGYIVGVYETVDAGGATLTDFVPSFTAPFYTNANIIIADSQTETDIANCLIVQLTSGEIRNTLNLVDNVSNKEKIVMAYGDLTAYFGDEGLKNTSGYWFEGDGINPDDPIDVVVLGTSTVVSSLNETFNSATANTDFSTNGWLNANKQGERYWQGKEFDSNKYVQATAYGSTSSDMESWLVTPGVTLTTPKKLNFDSATGYYKHAGLTVWVSTDFDGNGANLFTATWTQINPTIAAGPADSYSEFVNSGDIDLSAYSGTIYVLFKYIGDNSTNTTTFQIDNVQIVDL